MRFDHYGDVDVLNVVDVERPVPGSGQALVRVKAAGINPGEASIRKGLMRERWPATFPSGEGSDLAGVVEEVGPGVDSVAVGDEVIGWTDQRASHAELVVVPVEHLITKPAGVSWEAAGALCYVKLGIEELGVAPERIDTIIDWGAAQQFGTKIEGTAAAATPEVMAELAEMIDRSELEVPIAKVFPLEDVRDAFRELEHRHTRGKIVLKP